MLLKEISQGDQLSQIGAEDNGQEVLVVAGDLVVVGVEAGTLEDVMHFRETLVGGGPLIGVEDLMILWHAMSMGCMAIWHVTVPFRRLSHRMVAVALLRAVQYPGNDAQETEAEDGMFASGA